jgi:hypothetical protein
MASLSTIPQPPVRECNRSDGDDNGDDDHERRQGTPNLLFLCGIMHHCDRCSSVSVCTGSARGTETCRPAHADAGALSSSVPMSLAGVALVSHDAVLIVESFVQAGKAEQRARTACTADPRNGQGCRPRCRDDRVRGHCDSIDASCQSVESEEDSPRCRRCRSRHMRMCGSVGRF